MSISPYYNATEIHLFQKELFCSILIPPLFFKTSVISDVQFASIMEMYSDPYGSFRLTNFFNTVDQCPLFYSKLPGKDFNI